MPWFTKKRKKKASFDFSGHIQGRFRHFSAISTAGWYYPICQIRPDFGRISPVRRELKPIRHESSCIGANRVESAWIWEKKKKQIRTDAQATVLDAASRIAPRQMQVPRLCFLETKYHSYLSKKKKLSLQVYIKNWWKLNAIISPKKARKLCSFQIEIILRHTNHLLITKIVHIFQKTITLFQTIQRGREIERTHAHKRK